MHIRRRRCDRAVSRKNHFDDQSKRLNLLVHPCYVTLSCESIQSSSRDIRVAPQPAFPPGSGLHARDLEAEPSIASAAFRVRGKGGCDVERLRQGLRHERRDADAAMPHLDQPRSFHGVARNPENLARSARPFHHPFRALDHHQARSMARSRPGQAVAAERLHAVL